jgi:polysaccharide export outer membrane protein
LETLAAPAAENYVIGAGDDISVYVWRNIELSVDVIVRPDGKISIPLVDDMQAAGRTPTDLARGIEVSLAQYIQSPIVSVVVSRFVGLPNQQIRVIGEAAKPRTMIYRAQMTVLDVLIEAGGLTTFAAGNRAVVVRTLNGARQNFSVRLDDLVRDGDISANVPVAPGDIIIIPQSWF